MEAWRLDAAMEMEMKAGELAAFLLNFSKRKRINSNPRLNSPYYSIIFANKFAIKYGIKFAEFNRLSSGPYKIRRISNFFD
jgi:hypothetical protein